MHKKILVFVYGSVNRKKSSGTREVIFLMNLKERIGEFLLKPLVCIETNTKLSRSRSWVVWCTYVVMELESRSQISLQLLGIVKRICFTYLESSFAVTGSELL